MNVVNVSEVPVRQIIVFRLQKSLSNKFVSHSVFPGPAVKHIYFRKFVNCLFGVNHVKGEDFVGCSDAADELYEFLVIFISASHDACFDLTASPEPNSNLAGPDQFFVVDSVDVGKRWYPISGSETPDALYLAQSDLPGKLDKKLLVTMA